MQPRANLELDPLAKTMQPRAKLMKEEKLKLLALLLEN